MQKAAIIVDKGVLPKCPHLTGRKKHPYTDHTNQLPSLNSDDRGRAISGKQMVPAGFTHAFQSLDCSWQITLPIAPYPIGLEVLFMT